MPTGSRRDLLPSTYTVLTHPAIVALRGFLSHDVITGLIREAKERYQGDHLNRAVTLEAIGKFAAFLAAHASFGPPKVQAAISATADLAASLTARFSFMIDLGLVLSSPGALFCYTYSGLGNALGGDLTSALSATWGDGVTPSTGACVAAILAATDSVTATVMTGFFGGL